MAVLSNFGCLDGSPSRHQQHNNAGKMSKQRNVLSAVKADSNGDWLTLVEPVRAQSKWNGMAFNIEATWMCITWRESQAWSDQSFRSPTCSCCNIYQKAQQRAFENFGIFVQPPFKIVSGFPRTNLLELAELWRSTNTWLATDWKRVELVQSAVPHHRWHHNCQSLVFANLSLEGN